MNSSNESLDNPKHERYGKILQRRRNCLYALQWFFLSGLFTLTPFLYSTHGTELGLSTLERTWIHIFSSLILTLVCTIAIHRNFHTKLLLYFKPLVVTFLIIAVLSHVALLFVPRVQRIARYPKITLNCTTSGSLLRIELCPNLIRTETLLNHPSAVQFATSNSIQSTYSSFQCDHLLRTSSWSAGQSSKANANHFALNNLQSEIFHLGDGNRETNYNNEFTTFSMTKCKGVCPSDFHSKYEPNKEHLLRYYERQNIMPNQQMRSKTPKPYNGVMDSEYDVFSGRTQIFFRKSLDSKNCYTPDPDTVEPSMTNFQAATHPYIHNVINFPALNSTIFRVKQIRFHSKIQSWQAVSTIPQLPDLMYPYPSCLFAQTVPIFMDGQSFESIICPNPLENTRYSKSAGETQTHFAHDNNVDNSYQYEPNNLDANADLFGQVSSGGSPSGSVKSETPISNLNNNAYYQTNCDTICNTNLIYRGQYSGKYYGHHSMQLPYSPIVCHDIIGDPLITFYTYLVIRCIADLSLMVCFLIIDSLGIYYTSNFDTIYGGFKKAISLGSSTFIWPVCSGLLIDYYSSIMGKPDYSPAFVLFVGFLLIGCSLVISLHIEPSTNEFNYMRRNNNISNTFIADLCGSNLNCDKIGKDHKHNVMYSSRPELNQLVKVSFKSKLMLVLILPFILLLGFYFSLCQLQMNTYYLSLGASKFWIGLVISIGFLISFAFILIVKPLLSAIGRMNLIVLGFIFYALQFAGDSLLSGQRVKWSLIPFNAMVAFSFVLSWIGCTSHLHHLMKLNRLGHVKLQLSIGLIQFGYGRILAAVVWFFWYYYYDYISKCWLISYFSISEFDDRPINRIEMLEEMNAFRVLLRILSVFALVLAIVLFIFYHLLASCDQVNCKWHHRRDQHLRNRRRLVKESADEEADDDDLDNIEEEDCLTKASSMAKSTCNKETTTDSVLKNSSNKVQKNKKDVDDPQRRKIIYRPLAIFQSSPNRKKDKKNDKKDTRKPGELIKSTKQDKRKKVDIKEEMV